MALRRFDNSTAQRARLTLMEIAIRRKVKDKPLLLDMLGACDLITDIDVDDDFGKEMAHTDGSVETPMR